MINEYELRLGNKFGFFFKDELFATCSVSLIGINGIIEWKQDYPNQMTIEGDLNPIPLTPQILEACGFEVDSHICTRFSKGIVTLEYYTSITIDIKYHRPMKYLHQLQNFFFAVTDKELQVDLKKLVYQKSI